MAGFDLAKKNLGVIAEAGFEFELKLPGSEEPTGAFITVRGDMSKTVRSHARTRVNEFQTKARIAKKKRQDIDDLTLDEIEEMSIEDCVVRVITWKGFLDDGKEVPFTRENAERVLKEHSWIREQIMEVATEVTNFQ
jgi:hypothetical protein